MLNGYGCFVGLVRNGRFLLCQTNACWSMLGTYRTSAYWGFEIPENFEEFYIDKFDHPETAQYQNLLVGLINEITPCSIEEVNNVKYIRYRVLGNLPKPLPLPGHDNLLCYNQNLVLLNFIRNLWHEPFPGYSKKFFKHLGKPPEKYSDPLEKLTWANKKSCTKMKYSPGHSNVHSADKLVIKKTKQLLDFKASSTFEFLTTDGE